MDRPNREDLYRDDSPDSLLRHEDAPAYDGAIPEGRDTFGSDAPVAHPEGGYARMPASAPSPTGTPPMQPSGQQYMQTPASQRRFDPWNYREEASVGDGADVVGFAVEAIDGHIGKIDESSTLVGDSYLVVDTGPWIFGKRVLLPAGTVNHVDSLGQKVYVDRTKTQIKNSPEFDPDQFGPEYRDKVGGYYETTYDDQHSTYGDSRHVG